MRSFPVSERVEWGEVFQARDTRLGRTVAIKAMRAGKLEDPGRSRRFLQEACAASALNHPNIVTVYDLLEDGGFSYIVMERIAGRPLDQAIPAGGMRPEEAPSRSRTEPARAVLNAGTKVRVGGCGVPRSRSG